MDVCCKQALQLSPRHASAFCHFAHAQRVFNVFFHDPHRHKKFLTDTGKGEPGWTGLSVRPGALSFDRGVPANLLSRKPPDMICDHIHSQVERG
ncbi:Uncharacterized protein MLTONO_p0367 (plasmid) [Mesorhizobium loti]|nr:Uncharacterized protein MLTONO_p0367 [Mesorhizobium loti]